MNAILLTVCGLLVLCLAFFAASKKAGGVAIVLLVFAGALFCAAYFGFADLSHQQDLKRLEEQKQQAEYALLLAQVRDANAGAALKEEAFVWMNGARWGIALKTLAPILCVLLVCFLVALGVLGYFIRQRQEEDY